MFTFGLKGSINVAFLGVLEGKSNFGCAKSSSVPLLGRMTPIDLYFWKGLKKWFVYVSTVVLVCFRV